MHATPARSLESATAGPGQSRKWPMRDCLCIPIRLLVPSLLATTSPALSCVMGWSTTATRGPPVPSARRRPSTAQGVRPSAAEALACATRTAPYDRDCALPVPSVDLTYQAIGHTPPELCGAGFGEKHLMPNYRYVLVGQARNSVRRRFGTNGERHGGRPGGSFAPGRGTEGKSASIRALVRPDHPAGREAVSSRRPDQEHSQRMVQRSERSASRRRICLPDRTPRKPRRFEARTTIPRPVGESAPSGRAKQGHSSPGQCGDRAPHAEAAWR